VSLSIIILKVVPAPKLRSFLPRLDEAPTAAHMGEQRAGLAEGKIMILKQEGPFLSSPHQWSLSHSLLKGMGRQDL
jgi:hypothetical protein